MPSLPNNRLTRRSRRVAAITIAGALGVLAGVIALTTVQLRQGIRQQIAGRDGEVLHAVAMLHSAEDRELGLGGPLGSSLDPLAVALRTADLRGVLGVRVYDAHGRFVDSFPPTLMESTLNRETVDPVQNLQPVSHFHPDVPLWSVFYPDESMDLSDTLPLLEVVVPLHTEDGPLDGMAQFLVEGHSIAAEYARLDRQLAIQATIAFGVGGLVLTLALAWAFRRVNRAQDLLAERTENLARANQELVLAAKTSALGAVTAHLLHGLKNPLAGLHNFVAGRGTTVPDPEPADWQHAVASTRRMQAMIDHVISVLREDRSVSAYDVTLTELEEMVRSRVQAIAHQRHVEFRVVLQTDGMLPNRSANLVALILVNLCENALQATPERTQVTLSVRRRPGGLVFEVGDEGPGFPADTPLFMPCRSTKEEGTGVGLALCKQLANHLEAVLELVRSTSEGCVFQLTLPEPHEKRAPSRVSPSKQESSQP